MDINTNSLMNSYNSKSKKNSPYFIINKKISEINSISSLFTNDSNEKNNNNKGSNLQKSFGPLNPSLSLKINNKNNNQEISKISFCENNLCKVNNKKRGLFYLFKNKTPKIPYIKHKYKNTIPLRKFIFEKEKEKNIYLIDNKFINCNNNKKKNESKSLLNYRRNISINNLSVTNDSNKNDKENIHFTHNKNIRNDKRKKKFTLIKKPFKIKYVTSNNKYGGLTKKDFFIHFNSLLDNIIHKKEKEIDNKIKLASSNHSLFDKMYNNIYQFNRKLKKVKKFNPILHDYHRENTTSAENKKNVPYFYNNYLNKTKKVYGNLNVTYSELKNDITCDLLYDKKPKSKRKMFTEKELKIEEFSNNIKELKEDIGYEKPTIELFSDKSTAFNYLTGIYDKLNKLNATIAYKHRYYFANKYEIDLRKDLLEIGDDNDDYLFKFKKKLPHEE